jgi:AhpD family alkylhydroperoxidase
MERVKGIGPSSQAWEARILPLNHTRTRHSVRLYFKCVKRAVETAPRRSGCCRICFPQYFFLMFGRFNYRTTAPETYQALFGVHKHLSTVFTDAKLRALVELRVSQINGCAFCLDMHANEARHLGESQQRLDCVAAWREAPFFSERERVALAWAESITHVSETHVPDELYAEVKKHFEDKELVELTAIIGMINLWNRMSVSFRSEPKERQ